MTDIILFVLAIPFMILDIIVGLIELAMCVPMLILSLLAR